MNYYNDEYMRYIEEYIPVSVRVERLNEIIDKSGLINSEKLKIKDAISKANHVVSTLNAQGSSIQSPIVNLEIINRVSITIEREISDFINFLNIDIGVVGIGSTESFIKNYKTLINITILNSMKLSRNAYERYLIKLFRYEKNIFDLLTVFITHNSMEPELCLDFLKEQIKILKYYDKKIEFLEEKKYLKNEIPKVLNNVQEILNNLNK